MSYWAGPGGDVIVDPSGTPVTLRIHKHEVIKSAKLAENNHSGVSATNFEKIIPHYEWTIDVPFDDTNLPDTDAGLEEGEKVTLKFKDGPSGKFCILTNTSVEKLAGTYVTDEGVLMVVITGKGGTLTRQVT